MTTKKSLRDELEDQLAKELKLVSGKSTDPETGKPYTITAKSKVWDRVLKLEAIKAKLNEGQWGSGFTE